MCYKSDTNSYIALYGYELWTSKYQQESLASKTELIQLHTPLRHCDISDKVV